jgi:energy-coupling factor transporter ATP-binding protein EcfA2
MSPKNLKGRPYPGLRPFRPEEAHLFFGRSRALDQLTQKLISKRFVCISGASGSGKSSLILAGLLPLLQGTSEDTGSLASSDGWKVVLFRPGTRPLQVLSQALIQCIESIGEQGQLISPQEPAKVSAASIAALLSDKKLTGNGNLLLLVDQFEEMLFASGQGPSDEAESLVELLLNNVEDKDRGIHVLIAVRADCLGECADIPRLAQAINEGQYLLPRMTSAELQEAITGPAKLFGGGVEPALLSRLLADTQHGSDRLPLLQHGLARLWERAYDGNPDGPVLRLADYDRIGGAASQSLSSHAEEVLHAVAHPDHYVLAEKIFKVLTYDLGGTGDRVRRRPTPVDEIIRTTGYSGEDVFRILDQFRAPGIGFLSPPITIPLTPYTVVDLSHESLGRQWRRLREWARDEYKAGETYKQLLSKAEEWRRYGELLQGMELELFLQWRDREKPTAAWADRYGNNFSLAMQFLDESRRRRESSQQSQAPSKLQAPAKRPDPKPLGSKIFISYRRADTEHIAGRLYDHLKKEYDEKELFYDVDTIDPGVDFKRYIATGLQESAVMLALIGKRWANPSWNSIRGWLPHPSMREDYVLLEIVTALDLGVPVIPLLVDGVTMPNSNNLPVSIAELAFRNAIRLGSGRDFDKDVRKLLDSIDALQSQLLPKRPR